MPSTAPLFEMSMLSYAGAFRLPRGGSLPASFEFGGGPLAFNPIERTLFVGSRGSLLSELTVPWPATGAIADLPFAEFVQPLSDPFNGKLPEVNPGGEDRSLHGATCTPEGTLVLTASIYYDANNSQRVSHFERPRNLSVRADGGWHPVWERERQGFVAGMMLAPVPAGMQAMLGGTMVTGQTGQPIVTRGSHGPAAFAFDHARLAAADGALVPATPLLYYPDAHTTLGPYEPTEPNDVYNGTMAGAGAVLVAGLRSLLVVGRIGVGRFCYGPGTSIQSEDRQPVAGTTEHYCYDPDNGDKGQHAWPYRYQLWAYDLNELEQVRTGARQPWDVRPHGTWPLSLPYHTSDWRLFGAAYDPDGRRLFVSQGRADVDGFAYRSLIHVFNLTATLPVDPDPVEPPPDPALPVGGDTGGLAKDANLLDLFAARALASGVLPTFGAPDAVHAYDVAQHMVNEKRRRESPREKLERFRVKKPEDKK